VVATTTPKPVPKPAGKTVLRMDDALTRHNVGKAVTFDQRPSTACRPPVFPPDAPAGKNKDLWIWSIDFMTIR
jgi:hypothetical protein